MVTIDKIFERPWDIPFGPMRSDFLENAVDNNLYYGPDYHSGTGVFTKVSRQKYDVLCTIGAAQVVTTADLIDLITLPHNRPNKRRKGLAGGSRRKNKQRARHIHEFVCDNIAGLKGTYLTDERNKNIMWIDLVFYGSPLVFMNSASKERGTEKNFEIVKNPDGTFTLLAIKHIEEGEEMLMQYWND